MPVEDLELEPLGGEGGDGSASADPFAAVRASVDRYRQGRVKPSPLDPFASVRKSVDQYRAGGQYPVSQLTLEPLPSFQEEYGPVPRSTIEPAVKELTRQWQTPAGMEQRREEPPVALEPFRKKFGISALAPVERKPSIAKRLAMEVLPTAAAGLAAPFVPATTASFLARVLPEPFASVVQKGSIEEMFRAAGAITDIAQQEIVHRLVPTPAEQRDVNLNYYSTRSLDPKLSAPERQEYQQKYRDLKAKPEATGSFLDVLRPVIPGVVSTGLAAAGVSGPVAALATGKLQEAGVLDPLVLTRAAADTMIEWEGPFMQGLRAFHALGAVIGKGSKAGYRAVQAANAAVAGYFSYDQAKAGAALASEGRWPEAISQFGGATAMAAMGFLGALGIASANPNLSKVEIKGEWWKRFSGSIGKYDDTAKRLFKVATFNDGRQLPLYGEQITPEILKDVNAAVAAGDARVTGLSYDQLRDPQKLEVIDYVEAKQRTGIAPEAVRALEPLPAQVEERAVQLGATFESEGERTVREQIAARMVQRNAEIRDEEGNLKPGVTIRTVPPEERIRLAGIAGKTYRDVGNLDPADQTQIAQIAGEDNLLRSLGPPDAAKLNDAEFDTWLTDRRTIGGKWQVMADPAVTRAHAEGLRETVEALIARNELERADFALMNKVGGRPDKLSVADKKKFDAFDALVKDLKKQVQDARGKPAEVEAPAVTPTAPPPAVARPAEEAAPMGASEAYAARERERIKRALGGNRARLEDKNLRPEARKAAEVAVTQLEKTIEELDDAIHDRDVYNLGGPDWMAENERVEEILARHEKEKADYDRGGPEQFEEALPVDVQLRIRELALEGLPPANDAAAYQLVLESVDRATPPGEPRLSPEERKRITDNVMNWFWRPAQEVRRPLTWDEVQAIADDVTRYYLGGPPSRAGEMPIPERRRHTPEELEDIAADVANYWRGGGVTREPGPPRRMNAEERQAVADRARERAEQARGRPPARIVAPKLQPAPVDRLADPALPEDVKGVLADLKLPPVAPAGPPTIALPPELPAVGERDRGYIGAPPPLRTGRMHVDDLYVDPRTMQYKRDVDPSTGAGHSLDDIAVWDPGLAGTIAIWWNPENQKFTVVNGHTRLAAAKRLGETEINVLRIEAPNAREARANGALINIAEGNGTVFDAAKFFRDTDVTEESLTKHGVSLKKDFVRQALDLARLDERLFEMAVNGEIRPERAATIGRLTTDPTERWAILETIKVREKRPGAYVNNDTIAELYNLAKLAGKKVEKTASLFGETDQEKSLLMTMAQESVGQRKRLTDLRNHYAAAATKSRAEVLREGENVIEWEENARRAAALSQEIEVYDKLSRKAGPIADVLSDAARRIENGEDPAQIRDAAQNAIRAAISETLRPRAGAAGKEPETVPRPEPPPELVLPPKLTVKAFEEFLRTAPGMTPEQGDAQIAVAKAMARGARMAYEDWVAKTIGGVRLGGTYWDTRRQEMIDRGELSAPPAQVEGKTIRGSTDFLEDGRAIIHLFNDADASTAFHELYHAGSKYMRVEDRAVIDRWLDGLDLKGGTERQETEARAWEHYLRDGKAPTAELQPVFARIMAWMREVYTAMREHLLVKPNAEVEQAFDRFLGGKGEAGKAKTRPGPLEPLPPAPPKAVLFTPEETASDRTALKKAFGAAPAMQAEVGTQRFQLEALRGEAGRREEEPEPEIDCAVKAGLRVGWIPGGDQIPSRSWISPSGNFAEVPAGKTHDGVAHLMGTTSLSLMKSGWIRKPGEGYYEIYKVNPDVLYVIQQDMDATPRLLDDPRSVIYIDQAVVIGQPHTVRITAADYVQANYNLMEAVGQRFQFPGMQLLQAEEITPEAQRETVQAREKSVRAEAIELQRKRAEAIARHPMPEIVRLAREETPEQRMRRFRAETTGDRMFRLRDERAYKQVLRDDEGLQRIEHQLAAKHVEHDAWSRAVDRVERQATRLEAERQKANRALQRKMRTKADEASWREWKETTKPLLVGEVMGWADRPDLKQEELPGVPAGSGRVDPSTLAEIARVGDDYYRRRGLTDYDRWSKEMVRTATAGEKTDADKAILARTVEPYLKVAWEQVSGGPRLDPEILKIVTREGMTQYAGGRRDFASWSQHFIDEYGEKSRPYLDTAWRGMAPLARARAEQVVKAHPEAKVQAEADVGLFRGIQEASREEIQAQEAKKAAGAGKKVTTGAAPAPGGAPAGGGRGEVGGPGPGAPARVAGSTGSPDLIIGAGIEAGLQKKILTVNKEQVPAADESALPQDIVPYLTNFQRQGAASAIRTMNDPAKGGYLLSDGTGAGKTPQALAVAKYYLSKGDPVFIVSTAEVFKMYTKDTRPAGTYGEWMDKLGMTSERYRKGMDRFEPGKLYFGTYSDFHDAPVDGKTVLILDESAALKRVEQSQRGLAGVDMAARAKSVLFMTATPIDQPQHIVYLERMGSLEGKTVEQAYGDLGLISRTIKVRSKGGFQFDKKIWEVNPHLGRRVINDRINELTDRLIADGRMINRELSFDGVDMNVIDIPVPNEAHAILRTIEDELTGTMKNPALERALILMHQRRQLEPYKIDAAVKTARREIEQGRSVVVFMSRINRSDVIKRTRVRGETVEEVIYSSEGTAKTLRDRLIAEGVVKPEEIAEIHGNSDEKGPVAMGRFQGNQAKVVIATMESGGVGINLDDVVGNHPRSMIIMTAPFSAMENVQAIGRTWRMSSQSYPRVFYLRGEHPIDHWNFTIIQRKMQTLGAMVKGEAPRLDPNAMEAQELLQSERRKRGEEKPGPLMEMIPGMDKVLAEQQATKGKIQGEELTARFAGKIETKGKGLEGSPLFRGTEAAPQRELFGLEPAPGEKPIEPERTLFQEDLEMPKSLEGPSRDELHELGRLDVMDARKLGEVLAKMGPRAYRPEVFDAFLKRSQEQAREQGRMLDAAEATTKGGAARAAAEEEVLPPAGGGGDLRLTSGEGVTEETIKGRDIRSAQAAYRSQDQALELLPETRPIAEALKSGVDNEWIFRGTFMRRLAEPLEGLGIGGHGWLARKKFLEIGDILDRFEKPLEAIGQKSVRFKKEYDPDLAQRAAKIRDILNEIWEMLPEEATRAGEKAGFIKNYLTHIERVASSSNDLMAGIQQVWDYNFRKPFDDLLAPFKRRPYEYKIQKDAEGQIVRDKSGKPVYLRPTGMGKPGSPFVEHRAGKMEHYELDVRRVLPAYVDSIARVIFRKPVAAEVAEMIRQLPDEIPRATELATSTLRNYTRYDVYREMASDWERFAYSLTRITGRSMLGGKLAIQAYHMGRYLLNTIPELGFKYAIIGAGKVLRHPKDSYNETARLGLLPMALRPAKFRLPTQALDNALGFFGLADFFDRSASYQGYRQKFIDAGMDKFEASQKAISEAKRVSAFIDPVRSIGFFTSSEGAWGATRIFTLQFKHQVARLVEQYSDIVLKARQDPARFIKFVSMAALVATAQSLTGLKLWHIGPYMLNFGAPAPQQIWKIGTALYQGDVEKAVEETVLWLTPAGLSARHEWQGIKKEGLAGLSAVRKHEPWFERGPSLMRQQPAIRRPLEETFGLKHVKPRRQSARERLGLEPLPLERMEMPQ